MSNPISVTFVEADSPTEFDLECKCSYRLNGKLDTIEQVSVVGGRRWLGKSAIEFERHENPVTQRLMGNWLFCDPDCHGDIETLVREEIERAQAVAAEILAEAIH